MKSERKKWIRLVIFLLPVLLLFTGINYLADPANVFHSFSEDMSEAMLEGHTVQVNSNNLDDREVLGYLIEKMPDRIDTMVWGSSIALCIDAEMAGGDTFLNMAVSSADYYDLMACMALMECNGKQADRMILALDTRLFDPGMYANEGRHDKFMDYSEYMIDLLENGAPDEKMPQAAKLRSVSELSAGSSVWSGLKQLFSVSYFQWSVEYIKAQGFDVLFGDRWKVVEGESTSNRYLPDYSVVYTQDMEAVTEEQIAEQCAGFWMAGTVTPYANAAEENLNGFEKLIQYLQAQGVEVELFLNPYAPALWDRVTEEQFPMIFELEEYAGYLAAEYGIEVQGSFNPYNIGMTNGDYYDALHVRKISLKEKFNFAD